MAVILTSPLLIPPKAKYINPVINKGAKRVMPIRNMFREERIRSLMAISIVFIRLSPGKGGAHHDD
jgi:hypothetical protein